MVLLFIIQQHIHFLVLYVPSSLSSSSSSTFATSSYSHDHHHHPSRWPSSQDHDHGGEEDDAALMVDSFIFLSSDELVFDPDSMLSSSTTTSSSPSSSNNIRRWGCHITATPFIFVHIGKAGGGSIRRRIAVTALGYDARLRKGKNWSKASADNSFYPLIRRRRRQRQTTTDGGGESLHYNVTFCNSYFHNFRPGGQQAAKTFEGTMPCTAGTAIGQAIACPDKFRPNYMQRPNCGDSNPASMKAAFVAYTGHNYFGAEIHWLPGK